MNLDNSDVSLFFAWRQEHADKICPCGNRGAVYNGAGVHAHGTRFALRIESQRAWYGV